MSDTPSLPSGLVTFMFTDIVGSTDMKGKMPGTTSGERQEAFREKVKAPHDAIIIDQVRKHGGRIVKGTGDGFLCAFSDAEKAVVCAVEIQREIGNAMIFTPSGTLQIRIGLNSGQAEAINNDYTASAVDKAARVESKCEPGNVYLSRETHELIRGKVRNVSTASAGSQNLKGVAEEELFVAFAAGSRTTPATPAEAPAKPFASTAIPNNLPRLQPFFGREKELADIARALDPTFRTWGTLIDGDGGKGKTALAIRAAYICPPAHFDRIAFVSMKQQEQDDNKLRKLEGFALSSWMQMLNEIARVLELPEVAKAPENERARQLRDKLDGRRVLLLLDNLETLSDSEQDQLFTFLEYLPSDCKALLTSRTFAGNKLMAIELPKLDQTSALQILAEIAEHNPPFAKSSEADRTLLYEQTHGNALLLRWVAGQVGSGHCTNIGDALAYMAACPAGNDPLAYIFDDVVNSLGDQEIDLLAALTWPNQPIPVEAITEIGDVPLADARRLLKLLTNRSLVVPDQEEEQYALVPMVADFLRRKQPSEVAETGSRLEQRAYAVILENGDSTNAPFKVLNAAWPTITPALPFFVKGPNARFQSVCEVLQVFLTFTGRWDECLSLNQQAEAMALSARDHGSAGWRALHAGHIHKSRRQADEVLKCADRAAAHWRTAEAGAREQAFAIQLRALGHQLNKDYPEAIVASREGLILQRAVSEESRDVVIALNDLAEIERASGDLTAAEREYKESLRVAQLVGFAWAVAAVTGNLAALSLNRKDWASAETRSREALVLSEELGQLEMIGKTTLWLAVALVRQAKYHEALPHAQRAVEIFTQLDLSSELEAARAALQECNT